MLTGFITGFFAAMLGWQINIIGIHRGLARGKSGPLLVGLGATTADFFMILIAFAGALPLVHNRSFWTVTKWFGIATILLASFRILFHKQKFNDPAQKKKRSPTQSFIMGLVIVGGNPAIYLMWIGIISFMMTHLPHLSDPEFRPLFLAGFFAGSMAWFTLLSFFILDHIRQWGENRLHLISRLSAVFLLIAAIVLIFENF